MIEGALTLNISSILFLLSWRDFETDDKYNLPTKVFSDAFGFYIVLTSLVVVPSIAVGITRQTKEKLESPQVKYLIGNIYFNLNLKAKSSFYMPLIFVARRLVISYIVMFMQDWDGG
jgi:hypothetical protein